jgi:ligand-binding sensor domain-containing protein
MCFVSRGQQLIFQNRTDLNLPAQETYNVMQDSKGYIWISSEQGLCRYNGSSLRVFNKTNGLPEKSCYAVKEDKDGVIWVATSANRILKFENDRLIEAPFSKAYSEKLLKVQITYAFSFSSDSIIMNVQNISFIAGKKSTAVRRVRRDTIPFHYFIKNGEDLISIKEEDAAKISRFNQIKKEKKYYLDIRHKSGLRRIELPFTGQPPNWRILSVTNAKGDNFIGVEGYVIKLDKKLDHTIYKLPSTILSIYCDKDGGLWAGTLKGGVYYWSDCGRMDESMQHLSGLSITGICEDKEKGLWCTTIEKGVFYSLHKNLKSYASIPSLNTRASLLTSINGKVYVSSDIHEVIELGNKIKTYPIKQNNTSTLTDLKIDKGDLLLAGKAFIARTNLDFKLKTHILSSDNKALSGANELAGVKTKILAMKYDVLYEIKGNVAHSRGGRFPSKANCIYYDGGAKIFLGCDDGLYTADTISYKFEKQNIDGKLIKIFRGFDNELWVLSKEGGIFIVNEGQPLTMKNNLQISADLIFDAAIESNNIIWVATDKGIIKLIKQDKAIKQTLYTKLNGLPAGEIYKIACDSIDTYFTASDGVFSFPLQTDLLNSAIPAIYLNTLKVNGDLCENSPLVLPHDKNSLSLNFDVLTFKRFNTPRLLWKLICDQDSSSNIVDGSEVNFDNLTPGEYDIEIWAMNNDSVLSSNPVRVRFTIEKPFWQTAWFIIVCSACLCIIILLVIKGIINRIKAKEEEKTKINKLIAESQLSALQAQMNPHFIFNAINSIQNYILKKQEHDAYSYLAKFSKLIRMVLNNSQQKTLNLRQELETIQLYVELEQVRFKNSFDFDLKIGDEVNEEEITVPTMLIQPYIENAIWHGLMNLGEERKGRLLLSISVTNDLLSMVIEDNGIGRKQSQKYKKNSPHKPVAMHLTEQRLKMINTMQDFEDAKVLVSDLHDETGKSSGTRVEIFLPILN